MFFVWLFASLLAAYVFRIWAISSWPWLSTRRRALEIGLLVLCLVPPPITWLVWRAHASASPFAVAVLGTVSTVVITLIMSAVPLGAIHALLRKPPRTMTRVETRAQVAAVDRRRVVEGVAGCAVLGGVGSMLGWGIVRGRHDFTITDVPVRLPGLPKALDGYTIAQISDIHAGTFVGERELDEGLDVVKRARADLLVVTGDLVDVDASFAGLVAGKLRGVAPRDGVFASLGNHDYFSNPARIARDLRAAGIGVLINESRCVRPNDGGGFSLVGVDDKTGPRFGGPGPRLDVALVGTPPDRARVLLSHQPTTVDLWPGRVPLQMSGHTHGGQINPGSHTLNVFFKYLAGPYAVGGTTLYVNRGFGTVGPPARIGSPPEVARFILLAA